MIHWLEKRRLRGFALGSVAAEEAELLTLAVDPTIRRRGVGRWLLSAFETEAIGRGAHKGFLEVADDNAAALALYFAAGWEEAGRRPGYYPRPGSNPASALILRKAFKALCAPFCYTFVLYLLFLVALAQLHLTPNV